MSSENEQVLVNIAEQIEQWQKAQRPTLTDAAMIRRFPGLGSSKTYAKIRKGDLASYNVEAQIEKFTRVLEQLEEIGIGNQRDEIYEDFGAVVDSSSALLELMRQSGNKRCLLLEGPTGSGKSTVKEIAVSKFPGKVISVNGRVAWSSANCLLGDILKAVDPRAGSSLPVSGAKRFDQVVDALTKSNKVLWLDESHRMNADGLNVIIDLVNATESHFVLGGISTLWQKLTARHFEEARQLLQNRLFARVRLAAPTKQECAKFLSRRCPGISPGEAEKAAEQVQALAEKFGRFGFLYSLAERVRRDGGELDARGICQQAEALKMEVGK